MLTAGEIKSLLSLLAEETIVKPSTEFPYRISATKFGYSDDPEIGKLQAKLSMMLQAASR